MKVIYYGEKNEQSKTKDLGDMSYRNVKNYSDDHLFFCIPDNIMKVARSKRDRLVRRYALDKLRFLFRYDFELYMKSDLCVQQDSETFNYMANIPHIKIEEFNIGKDKSHIDVSSGTIDNTLWEFIFYRIVRYSEKSSTPMGIHQFRQGLVKAVKSNYIKYYRMVKYPTSPLEWYNNTKGLLPCKIEEQFPDFALYLSILSPIAYLPEDVSTTDRLFDDDNFILKLARALFQTHGAKRSILYHFLRLCTHNGTKSRTYKNTNMLSFSVVDANITESSDNFLIVKEEDELGNPISEYRVSKEELVSIYSLLPLNEESIVTKIQNKLIEEYSTYLSRNKERVENELSRQVIINFVELKQENWEMLLALQYKNIDSKCEEICGEADIYSMPNCIYFILLNNDNPEKQTDISESLTEDIIFFRIKNKEFKHIPLYKEILSLNLIKTKIKGDNIVSESAASRKQIQKPEDSNRSVDPQKEAELDAAIGNAIDYITPIIEGNFLTGKTNSNEFRALFKDILCIPAIRQRINDHSLKTFDDFNLRLVLNIIGLLIEKGFFVKKSATQMDAALQKYNNTRRRHRDEITGYNDDSTYGYLRKFKLIPDITEFIEQR